MSRQDQDKELKQAAAEQRQGETKQAHETGKNGAKTNKAQSSIMAQTSPTELAAGITQFLNFKESLNLTAVSTKWRDFSIREHLREKAKLISTGFILNTENIETMHLPNSPYTAKHTEEQIERFYQAAFGEPPIMSADALIRIYKQALQEHANGVMGDDPTEFLSRTWECIRHKGFYTALSENLIKLDDEQAEYARQANIPANEIPLRLIGDMDIALIKLVFSGNGVIALRNGWLDTKDFAECLDDTHRAIKEKILSIILSDAGIQAMQNRNLDLQGLRLWTRSFVAHYDDVNRTNIVNGIQNFDVNRINNVADLQALIVLTQQQVANNAIHADEEEQQPFGFN